MNSPCENCLILPICLKKELVYTLDNCSVLCRYLYKIWMNHLTAERQTKIKLYLNELKQYVSIDRYNTEIVVTYMAPSGKRTYVFSSESKVRGMRKE